jgi:hypothetical protein
MKTLFLMCAFLLGLTCSAQSFNAKDLVGTQWEDIQGEDEYASEPLEFSTTNMTLTIRYKSGGRTVTLNNQYYLSDTIPSIFEEQKVGKNTIGKYLVYYVKKRNMLYYYTITKFTDKALILHHKKIPGTIGGPTATYEYRRIK